MGDGSAYFKIGETVVISSVLGPRSFSNKEINCSNNTIICEYAFNKFGSDKVNVNLSKNEVTELIHSILKEIVLFETLHDKYVIIKLQVIRMDGNTCCACINAAMLALADAGIPCKDLISSCSAGYINNPILDFCFLEETIPRVYMALSVKRNKISFLRFISH